MSAGVFYRCVLATEAFIQRWLRYRVVTPANDCGGR